MLVVDTEYKPEPGALPVVHTLCAYELVSGRTIRLHGDELRLLKRPPFGVGPDDLFICYSASADVGAMLALGYDAPANVFDAAVEFRMKTNGLVLPKGSRSLVNALKYFGLQHDAELEKVSMQSLGARGEPYTLEERTALIEYCMSDVVATAQLFNKLEPSNETEWWRALLRGRYAKASASAEHRGIPLDVPLHERLSQQWDRIAAQLIERVEIVRDVYDGPAFSYERFEQMLQKRGISDWPRTGARGLLKRNEETLGSMALRYPELGPLRDLIELLGELKTLQIACGPDGRHRTPLWPFGTVTGRNTPSSHYIFGVPAWLRSLIKPAEGRAIIYADYRAQEFAVGAWLSGDEAMRRAYETDPYMPVAIRAGLAPVGATKETHGQVREVAKRAQLATGYSCGPTRLASILHIPVSLAEDFIRANRAEYQRYWEWVERRACDARVRGWIETLYGWRMHVSDATKRGTLLNYAVQGNAAVMTQLATIFADEVGLQLIGTVHDALVVECSLWRSCQLLRRRSYPRRRATASSMLRRWAR
jgi:DNA polymerase family A